MVSVIDIREAILNKQSEFNVKRFKVGKLKVERPIKVIDAKNTKRGLFEGFKEAVENPVFESSKVVSVKSVNSVLRETDDEQIKRLFAFREWMSDYPFIISLTFTFNPYEFGGVERISGYFDYYTLSNPLLFVPNIKTEKTIVEGKKKKRVKIRIIDLDNYIKFVDEVFEILSYKNDKPIFVPVSLRFGMDDVIALAKHYLKREYFCIWFDFEGSAITKPKIARIRAFLREFDKNKRLGDVVVYSTNVKREIISNIRDEKVLLQTFSHPWLVQI